MFKKIMDRLAGMIFKRQPPIKPATVPLIDRIHESGWSDTTADDWFYKEDVIEAVILLKRSSFPITNERIDEIFGDMTKDYDDILQEAAIRCRPRN